MKLCRISPTFHLSGVSGLLPFAKNGSMHTSAVATNKSSSIQFNLGPVSSIAGSELISRILTLNGFSIDNGEWLTRKSTPNSSKALGRGFAGEHISKIIWRGNKA